MAVIKIKKGLDLNIAGRPGKVLDAAPKPETIALHPVEFKGVKPKLLVKENDMVKGGTPIFFDKNQPAVKFVSPVPGRIEKINYGQRRVITSIIIKADWNGEYINYGIKSIQDIRAMTREEAVAFLQESGAFIYLRQRPFDKIPYADRKPKTIFVNAMNTAPNAGEQGFMLKDKAEELQAGIEMLKKLTDGKIHFVRSHSGETSIFESLNGVEHHTFAGPHPAGLVGTHIHFIDPIKRGDIVWYLDAVHLAAIGSLLKTGEFSAEKIVCVAGSGVKEKKYFKAYIGTAVESLLSVGLEPEEQRIISGTVIYGDRIEKTGHIGFYQSNLQVIPEGRKRTFMGWAMPGLNRFSSSARAFLSSLLPSKPLVFDTNIKGGKRTIIWTELYDSVTPLDIYTNFLVKAILADEIEEAEKLGLLEAGEEDFALATYICPSKIDFCSIISQGLETIEKEGY